MTMRFEDSHNIEIDKEVILEIKKIHKHLVLDNRGLVVTYVSIVGNDNYPIYSYISDKHRALLLDKDLCDESLPIKVRLQLKSFENIDDGILQDMILTLAQEESKKIEAKKSLIFRFLNNY